MDSENELITQIKNWENKSASLELSSNEREEYLQKVGEYANEFINKLPDEKAFEIESSFEENALNISGKPQPLNHLIETIAKRVNTEGINPQSGGHFGYIPGSGLYASALGDFLAAITNRYAGVFYASPGAVRMENSLIKWACELIGYKDNYGGNLTSGGSYANLIAIATARIVKKIKLSRVEDAVIYLSQQAHHSILKALKITGLEDCTIREMPIDEHFRMDINALSAQIENDINAGLNPFMLIANAGSTDVGAVDPLDEMAAIAASHKLWFHVDAAYGGFFLLTDHGKKIMKGIEKADSVIMDPHKSLFVPYGLGMLLVKDLHHLLEANSFDANYMQDTIGHESEYSGYQVSPELSKHFRGLRMWLPLQLHGIEPFAAALNEKILLTQYFYKEVRKLNFKTGPFPDLSIVIFWYEPTNEEANDFNKKIFEALQKDGRIFLSSTELKKKFVLRFAALSFRSHLHHVNLLLDQLKSLVQSENISNKQIVNQANGL